MSAVPPLIPGSVNLADEYVTRLKVGHLTADDVEVLGNETVDGNLTVLGTITGGTLTDGTFSTTGGVVTGATIIAASDNVAANSLKTTGAAVNVAAAAPPVVPTAANSSQVLTATTATTATWQVPTITYLNTGDNSNAALATKVNVGNSAAPVAGDVLIATSGTAATWQPQSALTGIPASALVFAEYTQLVQGTNVSVAASQANSFLVATPVYTSPSIVQGLNTTIGNVWTLAAGTYIISFGMNLSSTGPIGLYVGPAVGSLTFDNNTMTGSTVSTTWVQGQAIQTVAAGTVVAVGASVSPAVVDVSGTGAPNYTVRVTFLKIA